MFICESSNSITRERERERESERKREGEKERETKREKENLRGYPGVLVLFTCPLRANRGHPPVSVTETPALVLPATWQRPPAQVLIPWHALTPGLNRTDRFANEGLLVPTAPSLSYR